MWDFSKPTKERSRVELELQQTFEYVHELEEKLRKLEAVVDALYFKVQISHSLLVISKVNNEKKEQINQLLKEP